MKRLLLLMMLALTTMSLVASIADVQLSIQSHNTVVGNEISIPIQSSNLNSLGVISYQIDLAFDPNLLSYNGYTKLATISANAMISVNEINGVLHIAGMAATALQGQGTLLYLQFLANQPGLSPLALQTAIMNTTELQNLNSGSLYIDNQPVQSTLSAPNMLLKRGTNSFITLSANGVANMNCLSFQFQLYYDPAVFSISGISEAGCIAEGWQISSRTVGNRIEVAGIGTTALSQNGDLIKLNIHTLEGANTFSALNLETVLFNAIPASEVVDGRVDVYDLYGLTFSGVEDLSHILSTTLFSEWEYVNSSNQGTEFQFQAGTDADWDVAELYSSPWQIGYTMQELMNLQPGTDVFIRVRLRIGDTESDWLSLSGHINMLPPTPALVTPMNDSLWQNPQIQLICAEAIDTDGDSIAYYFQITVNGIADTLVSDNPMITFTALDNSFISWKVRIGDGYQTSDWSNTYNLKVNTYNQPPYVITPEYVLTMNEDSTYQLNLNDHFADPDLVVGDSLRFSVTISAHIAVSINGGIANITPQANWFGNEYLVFRARDDSLAVATDTLHVIVQNTPDPPLAATLISPNNNQWNVSITPLLAWNSDAGDPPTGYRLWLGTNNPPTNLINGQDLGLVTSWQISNPLLNSTTYYWKVEAYNADGPATETSLWQFRTIANNVIDTFPYVKDFEDNVLLSGGWTNVNQGVASGNWRMNPSSGVNSSKAVVVGRSTGSYWFISPAFLCPSQGSVFSFSAKDYSSSPTYDIAGESFQILVSTTGNAVSDFTHTVASYTNSQFTTSHNTFTFDLYDFAGQVVYIALKRIAMNGNYIYVDNIRMQNASPVLSLSNPTVTFPATAIGESSTATLSLTNTGTGVLNGSLSYGDNVTGPLQFSGRSPSLEFTYSPDAAGLQQGEISITSSAGNANVNWIGNANSNVYRCDQAADNGFVHYPSPEDWSYNNVAQHSGAAALAANANGATLLSPWLMVSPENALGFWAKSIAPAAINILVNQGNTRDFANYELHSSIQISTSWQYYTVSLMAYSLATISVALEVNAGTLIDDIDLCAYSIPAKPVITMENQNLQWLPVENNTGYIVQFSRDLVQWETLSPEMYEGTSWPCNFGATRGFYRVVAKNGN